MEKVKRLGSVDFECARDSPSETLQDIDEILKKEEDASAY